MTAVVNWVKGLKYFEWLFLIMVLTIAFAYVITFIQSEAIKNQVGAVYGVDVVKTQIIGSGQITIKQDGQEVLCESPSQEKMEQKVPLVCDAPEIKPTIKITAK